jgi:hypothetical protein
LITLALTTSVLVACNRSTSAPSSVAAQSGNAAKPAQTAQSGETAKSNDAVQQKLQELSGSSATDCGRVRTLAPEPTQKASDCAMSAAKDKHAFLVSYEMPGLTVGYAGNSQGKLFSVQSEQPQTAGAQAEVKSGPCPAELRLAQSGRVTCMPPGSMGGTGANPHGAMPPATGQNPHDGGSGMMSMPSFGGTGAPAPSHPPAKKAAPPKQ